MAESDAILQRLCRSSTAVREVLASHGLHDDFMPASPNWSVILSDLAKRLGDEQATTATRRGGHGWAKRDRRMRGVNHEEEHKLMYHLLAAPPPDMPPRRVGRARWPVGTMSGVSASATTSADDSRKVGGSDAAGLSPTMRSHANFHAAKRTSIWVRDSSCAIRHVRSAVAFVNGGWDCRKWRRQRVWRGRRRERCSGGWWQRRRRILPQLFPSDVLGISCNQTHFYFWFAIRLVQSDTFVMHMHLSTGGCAIFPSDVWVFHAAKYTSIGFAIRLVQSDTCVVQLHSSIGGWACKKWRRQRAWRGRRRERCSGGLWQRRRRILPQLLPSDVWAFHAANTLIFWFALRLVQADTCVVNTRLPTGGWACRKWWRQRVWHGRRRERGSEGW